MLPAETVQCPYCGETIELLIDDSVDRQSYIEDCSVCCRPIDVEVCVGEHGELDVSVRSDTE